MKNLLQESKINIKSDKEFEKKIICNFSFEEKIEARSERCLFFFQF
jgi:hypothetical protein